MKTKTALLFAIALPKRKIDLQQVWITACLLFTPVMSIAWSAAPVISRFILTFYNR